MPSGGVVLSPGQQLRIQENTSTTEEETQKTGKESEGNEETDEKKQKELQFQMLVVDPEGSGYTTESSARQISTPPSSPMPDKGYHTIQPQPVETKPAVTAEDNQSPYILPDSPQSQFFAPVADYTVVQEVDSQHSLLLNPPPLQSPPPCLPQHPLKALPAMPVGYITPDLLGNLSPWNDNAIRPLGVRLIDQEVPLQSQSLCLPDSCWKPNNSQHTVWMRMCRCLFSEGAEKEMWKAASFIADCFTSAITSINLMQR